MQDNQEEKGLENREDDEGSPDLEGARPCALFRFVTANLSRINIGCMQPGINRVFDVHNDETFLYEREAAEVLPVCPLTNSTDTFSYSYAREATYSPISFTTKIQKAVFTRERPSTSCISSYLVSSTSMTSIYRTEVGHEVCHRDCTDTGTPQTSRYGTYDFRLTAGI